MILKQDNIICRSLNHLEIKTISREFKAQNNSQERFYER